MLYYYVDVSTILTLDNDVWNAETSSNVFKFYFAC